jgi:hypothetical protein
MWIMKKSLLFSGLIVAVTLLCCYALVTADVIHPKKAVTPKAALQTKASAATTVQKVAPVQEAKPEAGLLSGVKKTEALPVPKVEKIDQSPIATKASAKSEKDLLAKPYEGRLDGLLNCSNPTAIACGGSFSGTNSGYPSNVTTYSCSGWNESGPERLFSLTITSPKIVVGTLSGMSADLDIFFLSICDEANCIAYGDVSFTSTCLQPGTYYIVVDGYYGAVSNFTLTVTCTDCGGTNPGETCATAIVIPSLPYTDTKNTAIYANDCANASPDVFYKYTVQSPNEYLTISLCGSDFDTYLWIWSDCCVSYITYNDDFCGLQSEVQGCFTAGDIWIQVEGYGSGSGNAILNVTSMPCPEAPENDVCPGTYLTLPATVDGTTLGATDDCSFLAGYPSVWYYFDLPYDCNNLTVEFCGSDPSISNYLIVLEGDCECNTTYFGSYAWSCPNGALINRFNGLAAGTYYLPIWIEPAGPFNIYVHVEACVPPPECPPGSLFAQGPTDPNGSWNAYTSDNNPTFPFWYMVFDNFWGVTSYIEDLHFWGLMLNYNYGWYDCQNENPMTFDIAFYQDAAGMPGAQVAAFPGMPITGVNTGIYYSGFTLWYFSTTLSPAVALPAGWLSIQGVSSASPECSFLWLNSPYGDLNSYQFDGASYNPLSDDLAFCLTGSGQLMGAACDPFTGNCVDNVPAGSCPPPCLFYANTLCADIQPPCGMGACCDPVTGECTQTTYANCTGNWLAGVLCDPNPCPPPGDNCETAIQVAVPSSTPGTNIGSDYTCIGYGGDVFYMFELTECRQITISLCNSPDIYWDSIMYLMMGYENCCYTYIWYDDDSCTPGYYGTSVIQSKPLQAGIYYVAIGDYGTDGDFVLDIIDEGPCAPPPENDLCSGATQLVLNDPNPTCGNNNGATGPDCPDYAYPDLWYYIVLPTDCGDLTIEWCGTTLSGSLYPYLYDNCDCINAMFCSAYEWDTCADGLISLHWYSLPAGTYYYPFNCSGYGDFCIRATCGGAPYCQPCPEATFTGPGSGSYPWTYTDTGTTCEFNGQSQSCIWGADWIWSDGCTGAQYSTTQKRWYTFTVNCATTITITQSPVASEDPQVALMSACPTLDGEEDMLDYCIGTADVGVSGDPETIVAFVQPGTYWVSVANYGGCGDYMLTITSSDCQLPVELTTLEAVVADRAVTLKWTTATEKDNARFDVQRKTATSEWTTVGQVNGVGNSTTPTNYSYTDRAVVNSVTYTYRLVSHDIDGTVHEYDKTVEATPGAPLPTEYALDQNFPNPFNPQTSITYAVKEAGFVTLKVYNLLGQNVATLVSAKMEAGQYTAAFTANDLPSGVYVYRLEVNNFTAQKKMVLLK